MDEEWSTVVVLGVIVGAVAVGLYYAYMNIDKVLPGIEDVYWMGACFIMLFLMYGAARSVAKW